MRASRPCHKASAVYGIAALVGFAGMLLTWPFLISRLWSGLTGKPFMLLVSVVSIAMLPILAIGLEVETWPKWLLADPARFEPLAWAAAAAVIAKYWLAAYTWRGISPYYVRTYLLIWFAGTASCLALGLVVWGMVRIYLPIDADRLRSIVIFLALLAVPLARVGLAPSTLKGNRHR